MSALALSPHFAPYGALTLLRRLAAAMLLAVLAACSTSPETTPAKFRVDNGGIGDLTAATPFDTRTIQRLFPGLTVTRQSFAVEGVAQPYISVSEGAETLFDIYADENGQRVASVMVMSRRLADTRGVRIGALFSSIYGRSLPVNCLPGWSGMRGRVFCPSPSAPNLVYVFSGPGAPAAPEIEWALPPVEQLRNWQVTQIVWSNPSLTS